MISEEIVAKIYNCLDLDLKEYFVDRKRIRILADMTKTLSILKPDKGNGIVVLKRSNYVTSLKSIFENKTKFTRLTNDPTSTRLNTLQNYLLTLRNRNEISESAAGFGRAHGLPKTHKQFSDIPAFRSIIDTTTTPHYNVGKFLASLLNPLTINDYDLKDTFDAVSAIKAIPQDLFDQGYRFVSFDVESLFTNVPLKHAVNIVLSRVFNDKSIDTIRYKNARACKKLLIDSCTKTAFSFDNVLFEHLALL